VSVVAPLLIVEYEMRIRSMLGLKSFSTATSILSGIEAMHIIKKGQLILRDKSVQNEMKFIHQLFGMAA
jgi:transposase-like protein